MIVVFVVDTSPSMGKPLADGSSSDGRNPGKGMSRLDLAKMTVEDMVRGLNRRVSEHNMQLQQQPDMQKSLQNIGLGFSPNDKFLLLSTGRQYPQQAATAACGAGGRLLVGYGDHNDRTTDNSNDQQGPHPSNVNSFQRELKRLQVTDWDVNSAKSGTQSNKPVPFPEDGGGAGGLNAALSAGLQLLSRYRLCFRSTENYGMGRLPSTAVLNPSGGGPAIHALQPACLILITDGECLQSPPAEGGGSLQLQYGNLPLREFYQEPFRWDQRIFCLGVGGRDGIQSAQYLHPHLRALCEVTGGSHLMLRSSASLSQVTGFLLSQIAPPRPKDLPIIQPTYDTAHHPLVGANGTFVSGGPVCCFQALEPDIDSGQPAAKHRAMLLYVPHQQAQLPGNPDSREPDQFQSPTWCIPESYFPSRKFDTLPPRPAQPNLLFSRFPSRLGSKCFDALSLIKALSRLDQLVLSNRKMQGIHPVKLLNRDVYICEWISPNKKATWGPQNPPGMEYFPVMVSGAGRPSLSEGEASYFSIGILHVPPGTSSLGSSLNSGTRVSTLTLLPPEPHILLPLLIRAAELEHRSMKKLQMSEPKDPGNNTKVASMASMLQKHTTASRNVHLDDHWRNEFRAYMFRLPPYYQNALKRSLRGILPSSANSLLTADGPEGALAMQCFSKNCLQKIRTAEQMAQETNDRLERQEAELRRRGTVEQQQPPGKRLGNDHSVETAKSQCQAVGYGQYDPRSTTESFLASLKTMPAPWRVGAGPKSSTARGSTAEGSVEATPFSGKLDTISKSAVHVVGDLPAHCLMAYYESRRRWIFGGSGLSTRGLFVDGVHNDGSNVQFCGPKRDAMDESLLSLAGVGVAQLNATTVTKMGDYRERLLWSRAPVVGYGSNDSVGVSATTAANGAPVWSVDDDAMPVTFFSPQTGEFTDSVQARVRSRLMVNFGNPYKDKRADSLVPAKYQSQSPSIHKDIRDLKENGGVTPPGSPPHDSYSASEGEGEAVFAGKPVTRKTVVRKSPTKRNEDREQSPAKRQKVGGSESRSNHLDGDSNKIINKAPPPPPPKGDRPSGDLSNSESNKHPPPPPKKSDSITPHPPSGKSVIKKQPMPPPPRPPPPRTKAQPPPPKPSGLLQSPKPPTPKKSPSPSGAKPAPPVRQNPPPKLPSLQSIPRQSLGMKKSNPQPPPAPVDLQSPEVKPSVDLPPGWMCVWSKSQKRWYFFDTKTNRSVWQWPPPTA
eukprot:scaffold709_cov197-Cylindrotheca_fusiformis.AAC.5